MSNGDGGPPAACPPAVSSFAVFSHFRFQVAAYQSQRRLSLYRSGQTRHREVCDPPVEELARIHIHRPPFATRMQRCACCAAAMPLRPTEAVAGV